VAAEADRAYGATVAKRRLSRRLATMRRRVGMRVSEVDDQLGWNRGRLQRIEGNRWTLPDPSYIRDLLRLYDAGDEEQAELLDLVQHGRARLWWRDYAGDKSEGARVFENEFPGFENDAARISTYMPLVIPGLLQTRPYIEALMESGPKPPAWRERALEARLRRQQILARDDATAPRLIAVITEASLMYRWGTRTDRRDQVEHLVTMSRRPNVELRLLRFEDGPHPGMSSLINIFEFPDDDQDPSVVYLENDTAIHEVTKAEDVHAYTSTFGQIRQAALASSTTTAYFEKFVDTLE
jgi:Domain of unknown function (DUF5753)/Helix-turn-helix domain